MNTILRIAFILYMATVVALPVSADETDRPREIDGPRGQVVMYQPQPDKLVENMLEGRAAGYTDTNIADLMVVIAQKTLSNYFNHVHDTVLDLPAAPPLDQV